MKLFWKIFFSTMIISAVCIVVSGYFIIHGNFRSQLQREAEVAQEYGNVIFYALSSEFADVQQFSPTPIDGSEIPDTISQIAYSINVDIMNQEGLFAIMDQEKKVLFSSLPVNLDKDIIDTLSQNRAGWTVQDTGQSLYLQMIRPTIYGDSLFYIETLRDVTRIYETQRTQYETLIVMMIAMIFVVGIVTFVIVRYLLGQIVEMTKVTKIIAEGNLQERVVPRGQDEISLLADHFNSMADHLEAQMGELQQEAERKELFVGAFSHELKTPLTSIIGYSDLLRQRKLSEEQQKICAEYIFSEGKRLETLSMRLLELIVLKNQTLHKVPTDVKTILYQVLTVVKPQLVGTDIKLHVGVEPAMITMEPELMKTVFLNLIDNARKSILDAGKIRIYGKKTSAGYVLYIRDSGGGMEPEELDKITEAFYMVDKSRSRRQGGAGLGLAICQEILTLHGFSISFDSQVGEGTTVAITMKEEAV